MTLTNSNGTLKRKFKRNLKTKLKAILQETFKETLKGTLKRSFKRIFKRSLKRNVRMNFNLRELRTRSESEMYESCLRIVALNVVDLLLCVLVRLRNRLVLVAPDV